MNCLPIIHQVLMHLFSQQPLHKGFVGLYLCALPKNHNQALAIFYAVVRS